MTHIFGDIGHYHKGPEDRGGCCLLIAVGVLAYIIWYLA
jgi:hypothetical protein